MRSGNMAPKYLDKTNFVLSVDCPTKLYYKVRPGQYQNFNAENTFLEALAKAGYQLTELAKCYFRDNAPHDLKDLSVGKSIQKTNELMKLDRVVIFEATFISDNLLLRADIIEKKGRSISLYEVKSKSYDKKEDSFFVKRSEKEKKLTEKWLSCIVDISFQKYILQKIYPGFNIIPYLKLVNKLAVCPTDGLYQKFKVSRDANGNVRVSGSDKINDDDLTEELLIDVNVDEEINHAIQERRYGYGQDTKSFGEYVAYILNCYSSEQKVPPVLIPKCAKCEFRNQSQIKDSGKMIGFEECWMTKAGMEKEDLLRPLSLDLWNYNSAKKKEEFISAKKFFLEQLSEVDIKPKKSTKSSTFGMSDHERRVKQIEMAKKKDDTLYVDDNGLREELGKLVYPLHFIDFETAAPVIPIVKGVHPYEGFSFQFSHHILYEDGKVEHFDEFINTEVGINPNLSFVRKLKDSLKGDAGSIFRYHNHENTYLNYIYNQVKSADDLQDKEEIIKFIERIAKPTNTNKGLWVPGDREMIDLCDLVQRFTFDPRVNGKTSIKKFLLAIVNESKYLQQKYSKPIYGSSDAIKSRNFKDKVWIVEENGVFCDPYTCLPKIEIAGDVEISDQDDDNFFDSDKLNEGSVASIAYLYMQYCDMSEKERRDLTKALLCYCELDTFAMVMIVEAWRDRLKV